MSRTRALVDLQTIDQQRAQVAARLAQITARLADDSELTTTRAAAADAAARRDAADRDLRAVQAQRAEIQAHIAAEEQKLYSGQVKAPKELQNLQREVDSLRRRLSAADDRAIEAMLARDAVEAELESAHAAQAAQEAAAATTAQTLAVERDKLLAARERLEPARARLAATVPAQDMALYDRLWRQHRGRAVAPLRGEHCGGCGMQLPRPVLDRLSPMGAPVQCGHCGRVLHQAG